MIRIENIGKVFNPRSRNRNEVLKDVSFELPETGLIAIYGKSGSGKTTLLNIIGGLDKQDSGKIYINNKEVGKNVDKVRNQNIGFVFQNYYLESGYTIEQIMNNAMVIAGFKDEKEIKKRSKEVLELVDMERFKHKQADALSGGQKQRVAIARALIKGADIILADEPTGNLDALNTMKIMDIFKEISKTHLVLIVTHEVTLIKKYADSYIKLVDGKLTDDDVIGEIFKYETEKNNIYIDRNDVKTVTDGNVSINTYGDPKINKDDIEIYSKDGKVFLTASKNITILDSKTEKKIVFTENMETKPESTQKTVPIFSKSTSKHNGKLFDLKRIIKVNKSDSSERLYSTANIFKQVFVAVIAIVMSFFALMCFEVATMNVDNKLINENSRYLELNTFNDVKQLPKSYYDKIDFFETKQRTGKFSYNDLTALSGIKAKYTPKAIEATDTLESLGLVYGKMPGIKQVLITRALAEKLKTEFRIKELDSDKAILLVLFENDYAVSGITEGDLPVVYMHKQDYVNFLGVYNAVQFVDPQQIFFSKNYINNTYSTEIVAINDDLMQVNEVYIELGRNALYKMMDDTVQADYNVQKANSELRKHSGRTGLEIKNSDFYVRKFEITRETLKTDIRIYVHEDALKNIFVFLEPNIDALRGSASDNSSNFYFEVVTTGGEQLAKLVDKLDEKKITPINLEKEYKIDNKNAVDEAISNLSTFLIIMVLLFFIYYFMEKSGSIKNSKEYGVYRAIGVNRSNLLYKETITTLINNIITYLIVFLVVITLMSIRYIIMNISIGMFLLIAIGVFLITTLIMIGISLIPYLFVIRDTPSEILSRYDI